MFCVSLLPAALISVARIETSIRPNLIRRNKGGFRGLRSVTRKSSTSNVSWRRVCTPGPFDKRRNKDLCDPLSCPSRQYTHTHTSQIVALYARARACLQEGGGGGGKVLKLAVDLPKPRILVGDRGDHGEGDRVLGGVIITNGFICIIIRGKYVT